jgi:hypothetical protein
MFVSAGEAFEQWRTGLAAPSVPPKPYRRPKSAASASAASSATSTSAAAAFSLFDPDLPQTELSVNVPAPSSGATFSPPLVSALPVSPSAPSKPKRKRTTKAKPSASAATPTPAPSPSSSSAAAAPAPSAAAAATEQIEAEPQVTAPKLLLAQKWDGQTDVTGILQLIFLFCICGAYLFRDVRLPLRL